jgi:hypothetical protein
VRNKLPVKPITPLLVILGVISVLAWLTAINGLLINGGGGNSLGGGIAAIFAFGSTLLLLAERSIVKSTKSSLKKIWLVQLPIAIIIVIFLLVAMAN